jgi:hypothetical protein
MGSFIKERLIFAYCWTHSTGRCKVCTCCYTFKKCKDFVNSFWKIRRYRHYHKTKAKYPCTLVEFRKGVRPFDAFNERIAKMKEKNGKVDKGNG